MDINSAYLFIQYVANKQMSGTISPAQFNLLAPIAQLSLINDRLGNVKKYKPHDPVPAYGLGISQKVKEELGFLYVKSDLAITAGVGQQPSNLLYIDTLLTAFPNGKIVTEVPPDEFTRLKDSVIKPPTVTAPIFTRLQTSTGIIGFHINPTSITAAVMFFVRRPTAPVWAYTVVNDEPVYTSVGSQNFETSDTTHLEVCSLILQAVGVNLDMATLEQYAQMEEAKGS